MSVKVSLSVRPIGRRGRLRHAMSDDLLSNTALPQSRGALSERGERGFRGSLLIDQAPSARAWTDRAWTTAEPAVRRIVPTPDDGPDHARLGDVAMAMY